LALGLFSILLEKVEEHQIMKYAVLFLTIIFSSCQEPLFRSKTDGEIHNLTGLDGCGWVIGITVDGEPKTLEPTNLSDFLSEPTEGMKIRIKYNELESASICMVGAIVELTHLEEE